MRKNGLVTCALMLVALAMPALAQEVKQFDVETLKPTPTVVKTGESLTQIYRVRFWDLSDQSKEIIVLTDEIKPSMFAPFEVIGLRVQKERIGKENDWDFVYTLRIINPKKGEYSVPKIKFLWVIKEAGKSIRDEKPNEFETKETKVNYVSTMTSDQELDVRDGIDLGSFILRAYVFMALVVLILLTYASWVVAAFVRMRKAHFEKQPTSVRGTPYSWKEFKRRFRELRRCAALASEDKIGLGLAYHNLLRLLLVVGGDELKPSMTARQMHEHSRSLRESRRNKILKALSERLVNYQDDADSGMAKLPQDLQSELLWLKRLYRRLRILKRVGL